MEEDPRTRARAMSHELQDLQKQLLSMPKGPGRDAVQERAAALDAKIDEAIQDAKKQNSTSGTGTRSRSTSVKKQSNSEVDALKQQLNDIQRRAIEERTHGASAEKMRQMEEEIEKTEASNSV